MNEKISAFPSKELYSSLLKSHPSVQSHLLSDLLPSSSSSAEKEKVKEVLGEPIVFFDTAGCEYWEKIADEEGKGLNDEGSKCNENEAAIVASWVGKLVSSLFCPFF
jgi:DNA polymerase alpha-associated DNA helicase A